MHTRWFALVAVLLTGYLAHFASKAFHPDGRVRLYRAFLGRLAGAAAAAAGVARVLMVLQKKRGLGVRWRTRRTTPTSSALLEHGALLLDKMFVDRLAAGDVGAEHIQ